MERRGMRPKRRRTRPPRSPAACSRSTALDCISLGSSTCGASAAAHCAWIAFLRSISATQLPATPLLRCTALPAVSIAARAHGGSRPESAKLLADPVQVRHHGGRTERAPGLASARRHPRTATAQLARQEALSCCQPRRRRRREQDVARVSRRRILGGGASQKVPYLRLRDTQVASYLRDRICVVHRSTSSRKRDVVNSNPHDLISHSGFLDAAEGHCKQKRWRQKKGQHHPAVTVRTHTSSNTATSVRVRMTARRREGGGSCAPSTRSAPSAPVSVFFSRTGFVLCDFLRLFAPLDRNAHSRRGRQCHRCRRRRGR